LDEGEDVNAKLAAVATATMEASAKGHFEIVDILKTHRAK
jgi:hypothetical protein